MAEEDREPVADEREIDPGAARERIASRAYALYEQRGRLDGFDAQDWLQAEQDVLGHAEPSPAPSAGSR